MLRLGIFPFFAFASWTVFAQQPPTKTAGGAPGAEQGAQRTAPPAPDKKTVDLVLEYLGSKILSISGKKFTPPAF